MQSMTFATTNTIKFADAQAFCHDNGIKLQQAVIEIDEIQGEDPRVIVADKVKRAYEVLHKPVIVSDDSWKVRALKGFPGPYMKSMNSWLGVDDFLRLMEGINDRTIELHIHLAYYDGADLHLTEYIVIGELLSAPQGPQDIPWACLAAMQGDNGLSIAEAHEQHDNRAHRESAKAWQEIVDWLKSK